MSAEATRGKPTVIAFVNTGSLPAQAQVDFLVVMAKHDADRVNYAVVALEPRENRELVELYRKSLGIPFPVALADETHGSGRGPVRRRDGGAGHGDARPRRAASCGASRVGW